MRMLWKVLLVCLVSLPVGVYVASAMWSSTADAPARREPIVIERPAPSGGSPDGRTRPTSEPTDDDPDDPGGPGDPDDYRVDTVNPSPDDIDDRHGDEREGDRRDRGGDDD